jgi:isoquinoline 1-oxidoreductase subunit beta
MKNTENRRSFLQKSILGSAGLFIGFKWTGTEAAPKVVANALAAENMAFNAYLQIASDGLITIFSPNPEIGQGIKTAFPLVVAEELDCDWEKVVVKQANLDKTKFERQLTGGSGAISHSWDRLRKAGATARHLLILAAAQKWNVDPKTLKTEKGFVISPSNQKLSYGELSEAASKLEAPKEVTLKDTKDFKLVGKWHRGVDNKNLLTGKPLYGIDSKIDGMYMATVIRPPFGMKLKEMRADAAKASAGIRDVIVFDTNKIGIIGKTTWEVLQARKKVQVTWEKDKTVESTADHNKLFKELMAATNGEVKRKDGDPTKSFAEAAKVIESEFQCPFLPHNTLEPQNFIAYIEAEKATLIGPTQTPAACQAAVAKAVGLPEDKITVEITKIGGGFGRRLYNDPAVEAAYISKATGLPIKLQWTREDDITAGTYRPAVRYKFRAALDKAGNMTAYHLKAVGMNAGNATRVEFFPAGAVENLLIESYDHKSSISTGAWRAPITNFLAFAEQSFLDEVAAAAGKDPVKFRLELYQKALDKPVGKIGYEPKRFIEAINMVTTKAGWGKKKKNIHQGFAAYFSHLSYVAQIAEVELKKGKPSLKKIYAVTDCGIVVNQSGSQNQIYGAIVDGLGHAMHGNLTFENGVPTQTNFDAYKLIRMDEIPEIEAYFVDNGIKPTGLGEPALPPTGGAVANAFAKATGKRFYSQPFVLDEAMVL